MKKGGGLNYAEELIYKLSAVKGLGKDILEIRSDFGIPKDGLGGFDKKIDFLLDQYSPKLDIRIKNLRNKYGISIAYEYAFDDFVLCGGLGFGNSNPEPIFAMIQPPPTDELNDFEYGLLGRGEPYVRLLMFANAKKTQILNFIDKHWNEVENHFIKQGVERPKRVRKVVYKERNLLIKKIYKMQVEELQALADKVDPTNFPHKSKYKDILIHTILRPEYGDISEGYIRKICSSH
jgi:hypothetical protein